MATTALVSHCPAYNALFAPFGSRLDPPDPPISGNNDRASNPGTYDGSYKPQKPADGEGRKGGRRREEEGGGRKGGNRKGGKGEQRFDRRDQSGKGRGKG